MASCTGLLTVKITLMRAERVSAGQTPLAGSGSPAPQASASPNHDFRVMCVCACHCFCVRVFNPNAAIMLDFPLSADIHSIISLNMCVSVFICCLCVCNVLNVCLCPPRVLAGVSSE